MPDSDSNVFDDDAGFSPMPLPGGVIRKEEADELTPVPFQFSDIRALAARILKRAQEQALQKIDAARKQVADMEKEAQKKAYDEAFPKGQQDGYKKGQAEGKAAAQNQIKQMLESERQTFQNSVSPVVGALQDLANIINEHRQAIITQAESDLLLLSVDIAKRLVNRELSVDMEAIRPIAIEAVSLVTERSNILARVNPADLAVMEEEVPNLKLIFPDLGVIRFEADPAIQRGGLIAATRENEVDMRLATRLAKIEEAILGYSGEAAQAPWSAVDPDTATEQLAAIEEQRQASEQAAQTARDQLAEYRADTAAMAEKRHAEAEAELAQLPPPPAGAAQAAEAAPEPEPAAEQAEPAEPITLEITGEPAGGEPAGTDAGKPPPRRAVRRPPAAPAANGNQPQEEPPT